MEGDEGGCGVSGIKVSVVLQHVRQVPHVGHGEPAGHAAAYHTQNEIQIRAAATSASKHPSTHHARDYHGHSSHEMPDVVTEVVLSVPLVDQQEVSTHSVEKKQSHRRAYAYSHVQW